MARVAVVGGGLAGIAAALDCADARLDVTLFESRGWLGGATFSIERDGLWLDNGQHVFMRCCTAYRALLERIGSTGDVTLQPRLDVPVIAPDGRSGRLRRSGLPAPLQLGAALLRYPFLGLADKIRLGPAVLALRRLRLDAPGIDERTFGSWLVEHRQSARAIEALWDLITLPTVNLRAAEASLRLAAMVFKTGLLEETAAADLGYANVPLRRLHGEKGLAALERAGVDVRLRCPVTAITARDGSVEMHADGGRVEADAVIVAVPHDDVEALVEGHLPADIQPSALGTSSIVNLHIGYDRPVMSEAFAAGVGSPVQFVFDRTDSSGLATGQLLAVSLSGADDLATATVDDLRSQFVPALAALFPAARAAHVNSFFVTREPAATFRGAPGSARHRPSAHTLHSRIFLAGAWTDTGWPATMEGAARSGSVAARAVARSIEETGRRVAA